MTASKFFCFLRKKFQKGIDFSVLWVYTYIRKGKEIPNTRKAMKMKRTLAEIIEREKETRSEIGMFGISACKEHIVECEIGLFHKDLFALLGEYVKRANEDVFFNKAMVLACWELINEQ